MNTGVKITAYAAALAAVFGAAYGVGSGVGPTGGPAKAEHAGHATQAGAQRGGDGHGGHQEATQAPAPGGLQVSDGGYTLSLDTRQVAPGPGELRFSIKDRDGRKVTAYKTEHGKELHLIVASRDLTVYRHLHPVRAADGTWSTPVDLPAAGGYKAFADFTPAADGAKGITLGTDLSVPGPYEPAPMPPAADTAQVEGYRVALGGTLDPGKPGELKLTVSKDGKPVTNLEPYLGAYGHLVALRDGDLAYLHVHPNPGGPGPDVSFTATPPSPGTYRLFLDFQHEGTVRTAAFTVHTGGPTGSTTATPGPAASTAAEEPSGHSH
ncbi:DUF748 domain-containing protein [Streptomyces bambusae]|uniref:DUF748 domain-containing protein n=1 Tax=Streptomyces bambusae TaxID=1550616 RepID=A0ABS6YYL3_9ACTN|nr:DUF748 domain-containing protein [Streptomyces bambusae]MBW5480569.1 hypothetical protein [Streptomyces bambusae]